jgi:hypothetical protein
MEDVSFLMGCIVLLLPDSTDSASPVLAVNFINGLFRDSTSLSVPFVLARLLRRFDLRLSWLFRICMTLWKAVVATTSR